MSGEAGIKLVKDAIDACRAEMPEMDDLAIAVGIAMETRIVHEYLTELKRRHPDEVGPHLVDVKLANTVREFKAWCDAQGITPKT